MKMSRRIIYYVVFVTLLWRVFAENEENIRNLFDNSVTRTDFGNLLQSLIKLNEQRVSVLQKLYKLEDYGIISEGLRSGDTKIANGNKNHLLLVVLSKNQSAPMRRHLNAYVVESIPSLDTKTNTINQNPIIRLISKNHQEKQTYNKEPAPVISGDSNSRQDKLKIFVGDGVPKEIKLKNRFEIQDGRYKHAISTNNRVEEHDRITKDPKEGIVEINIDNKIHPILDQGTVEYDSNEIALDSIKADGENESNVIALDSIQVNANGKNEIKDRFEIDDGKGIQAKLSLQRLEIENHSNKYLNTLKDMPDAKDHSSIDLIKDNGDLDDHSNKYPEPPIDLNKVDNYNKYPNTLKYMINADHQSSKYPKNENYNLGDHNNKIPEPDMYNGDDNSHKVPKILKDMFEIKDYPKSANDLNKVDNYNKYPNSQDMLNADRQSSKYSKTENYDLDDHNNKNPEPDMYNGDDNSHKVPKIHEDMFDIKDYPKSANDLNTVDHYNKYPNTQDMINADRQSSKYPITENYNLDDHNNKNSEPDMYNVDDNSHKIPNMLKAMFETGAYHINTHLDKPGEPKDSEIKPSFNSFEETNAKPESRKNLQKCIGKRALKLCTRSCNTAYKNVCQRLKCTRRSKRSFKKECKRSCTASFSTSKSKYSSEDK